VAEVEDIRSWVGADVVDPADDKIGKLTDVLVDARTGEPGYGIVKTGVLGHRALVPLAGAAFSRGHVRVTVGKDRVTGGPVEAADRLTAADESLLRRHFDPDGASHGEPVAADDDTVRFESAQLIEERQRQAEADLARAEKLEAEARSHDEKAAAINDDVRAREHRAADEAAERDRLLEEASAARAEAQRLGGDRSSTD
jgi:hypothetical protein